mmetsp:Transcript_97668/g.232487  ORF Transcript_97668/g.232487 Transcript_97668/m.232487 type:complete len:427 (+) Transcript_97668:425-1705(+)
MWELVEVGGVRRTVALGLVGRRHVLQLAEVDAFKEVFKAALEERDSPLSGAQHLGDELRGVDAMLRQGPMIPLLFLHPREAVRQVRLVVDDLGLELLEGAAPVLGLREEGQTAGEALVRHDAKRPEVRGTAGSAEEHLWCHVLWSAAGGAQAVAAWLLEEYALIPAIVLCLLNVLLCVDWRAEPKVQKLEVPLGREHQVVGLQIAVDEATLMNGIDGLDELRHVKLCFVHRQLVLFLHVRKEVTTLHELHHQIDAGGVLESAEQVSEPHPIALHHGVPLVVGLHVVLVAVVLLLDLLQGINLTALVTHQVHHSEGAFAKDPQRLKVLDRPHPQVSLLPLLLRCQALVMSQLPVARLLEAVLSLTRPSLEHLLGPRFLLKLSVQAILQLPMPVEELLPGLPLLLLPKLRLAVVRAARNWRGLGAGHG